MKKNECRKSRASVPLKNEKAFVTICSQKVKIIVFDTLFDLFQETNVTFQKSHFQNVSHKKVILAKNYKNCIF
jgi:hypothetical protein